MHIRQQLDIAPMTGIISNNSSIFASDPLSSSCWSFLICPAIARSYIADSISFILYPYKQLTPIRLTVFQAGALYSIEDK